jgi:hypothetical protein
MEKTVRKCWLENRAEQGKLAEKKIFFFSKKKTFAFILSKEYTFNALCTAPLCGRLCRVPGLRPLST